MTEDLKLTHTQIHFEMPHIEFYNTHGRLVDDAVKYHWNNPEAELWEAACEKCWERGFNSVAELSDYLKRFIEDNQLTNIKIFAGGEGIQLSTWKPKSPEEVKEALAKKAKAEALKKKRAEAAAKKKIEKIKKDELKAKQDLETLLKKYPHLKAEMMVGDIDT